jgi:hypothetical protein
MFQKQRSSRLGCFFVFGTARQHSMFAQETNLAAQMPILTWAIPEEPILDD